MKQNADIGITQDFASLRVHKFIIIECSYRDNVRLRPAIVSLLLWFDLLVASSDMCRVMIGASQNSASWQCI